ncbi:hypothetical protein KKC97_08755 [bacterium]|nr:hypothetical protein [bacterium]
MLKSEITQSRLFAVFALALVGVFAVFWGAKLSGLAKNPAFHRPVMLNGELLGYVELRPLELKNGLWSLDVFFEPLNQNLGVVRARQLRWWQIVDREDREGYPRMDLQRGSSLPGSPGDDDDPAYYTRDEKLGLGGYFSPQEIFADDKYWLRDAPQPENGASFEAWLVRQGDHGFERLVGFEWGLDAKAGKVWRVRHPKFLNDSRYNLSQILERSGFGSSWRDRTKPDYPERSN